MTRVCGDDKVFGLGTRLRQMTRHRWLLRCYSFLVRMIFAMAVVIVGSLGAACGRGSPPAGSKASSSSEAQNTQAGLSGDSESAVSSLTPMQRAAALDLLLHPTAEDLALQQNVTASTMCTQGFQVGCYLVAQEAFAAARDEAESAVAIAKMDHICVAAPKGPAVFRIVTGETLAMAACAQIALWYALGNGVVADQRKAFPYFVRACKVGHARSCNAAGWLMVDGIDAPQDIAGGRALIAQACDAGHAPACEDRQATPRPRSVDAPLPDAEIANVSMSMNEAIQRIDATHVTVAAVFLDQLLANPMAVAKGARMVPALKDGQSIGFLCTGITQDSVYAKIGLQNGDTLISVNDQHLAAIDDVLNVYTSLRDKKDFKVAILRNGKPLIVNIVVR